MSTGIPRSHRWAVLEDFDDPRVVEIIWRGPHSLLIRGGHDAGKTHLAAALARRWDARWVGAPALGLRLLRSASRHPGGAGDALFGRLARTRVLVIDDLLALPRTSWVLAWVLALVDRREGAQRATVVTTDATLGEVTRVDRGLAARLSRFHSLVLTGEERRVVGKS